MSDADRDLEPSKPAEATLDNSPKSTAIDVIDEPSIAVTDDHEAPTADAETGRRPADWGLITACFVIACALLAIVWGVTSASTGSDGVNRPDVIEDLSPVENAQQAFQQEQVMVDLEFGYEAVLIIDGIELEIARIGEFSVDPEDAGQQVSIPPTAVFDPGNSIITFRPSDDAIITSFAEGLHLAQVVYWKIEEGRENASSYRWSFEVV
ncbi:MAG: hypothetical protein ACI8V4_003426 [Ilumatobacter sp.]